MNPLPLLAFVTLAALPQQAEPAAKPANACVALLLPAVTGVDGDASTVAASIRSLFQSYLTGPSIRSLTLDARLPSQAAEEARQKDCPTLLTVSVVRKATGGGHKMGLLTQAAGTAAVYMPSSGIGGDVAKGAAVAGAEAATTIANGTRAKDEMTLSYKLTNAAGAAILPEKTQSAKAKSDGEDLLTPLVAKASEAIANAVTR